MKSTKNSFLSSKSIQIESIKNIFESLALFVAAGWAIFTFLVKDGPTLDKSASIGSELSIDSVDAKKVHVNFFVSIKNSGKSSFEINEQTVVRLWLIPVKTLTKKKHFEWESYMKTVAVDSIPNKIFKNHYSPENQIQEGFDFYVDRDPNQAVLVAIDSQFEGTKSWWEFWKWFSKKETWSDYSFASKTRCVPDNTNIDANKK